MDEMVSSEAMVSAQIGPEWIEKQERYVQDNQVNTAVILAAGLGTRLRREDDLAQLTADQVSIARTGIKALIPIDRPFLDYVLTSVADAGIEQVCLVIGPNHNVIRNYYEGLKCRRLQIKFAIQREPKGTADAVASAADLVGDKPFLMLNSDNYYPLEVLRTLRNLPSNGVAGFDRRSLRPDGIISSEQLTQFCIIKTNASDELGQIIEKPDVAVINALPDPVLVNMNCWRFGPSIFAASRAIRPSARGEFEIPDAVMHSIKYLGDRYRVLQSDGPVLDISSRRDIETVTTQLADVKVAL